MRPQVSLISVVIPTYNRAQFVTEAIDSVLAQTFTDYEIIVVDDGSTDDTRQRLARYDNRISYIFQENRGVSAARNTGIRASSSEWVAFLDSDDIWRVEYLSAQMRQIAEHPELCMQSTDCELSSQHSGLRTYFMANGAIRVFDNKEYVVLKEPFEFVINHGPWQVGSTVFRRNALIAAGTFDSNVSIGEDFDLMARVALQGPFGLIKCSLVKIFRREETIDCLTHRTKTDPLGVMHSDEEIYRRLLMIGGLKARERRALNAIMSANRRAMGNFYAKAGDMRLARQSFRRALWMCPSAKSFGKYILSLMPKSINVHVAEYLKKKKIQKQLRESKLF